MESSKHRYRITVQFANPRVTFDEPAAKEAIEDAVQYYNTRSLLARNKKQILDHQFSEDDTTLTIVLESSEELPMASKALKLLSTYLVQETILKNYLTGKQLFRMASEPLPPRDAAAPSQTEARGDDRLARAARYIQLLQEAGAASQPELDRLDRSITDLLKAIRKETE